MFYVSHRPDSGAIVSYTEAPDASHHHTPEGCEALAYASVPAGFTNSNGSCMMKVDIETKELVLINPPARYRPVSV